MDQKEKELQEKINSAENLIKRYGGIDEAHHKQWVLSEVLKKLIGEDAYNKWKAKSEEEGYDWDEGIAP